MLLLDWEDSIFFYFLLFFKGKWPPLMTKIVRKSKVSKSLAVSPLCMKGSIDFGNSFPQELVGQKHCLLTMKQKYLNEENLTRLHRKSMQCPRGRTKTMLWIYKMLIRWRQPGNHLLYNYLFSPASNIFYKSIDYPQFIFCIYQINNYYPQAVNCAL